MCYLSIKHLSIIIYLPIIFLFTYLQTCHISSLSMSYHLPIYLYHHLSIFIYAHLPSIFYLLSTYLSVIFPYHVCIIYPLHICLYHLSVLCHQSTSLILLCHLSYVVYHLPTTYHLSSIFVCLSIYLYNISICTGFCNLFVICLSSIYHSSLYNQPIYVYYQYITDLLIYYLSSYIS